MWFSLAVNDFGIKYVDQEHTKNLINLLRETYPIEIDWVGTIYCGINIEWAYTKHLSIVNMPT